MSRNRTNDDLLNPERFFYRMIRDYMDGKFTDKSLYHRAKITQIDTVGGQLEASPPNPPNSVKARIYSKGLDANLPEVALSIFYPFYPPNLSPAVNIGDHVFVFFEDINFSNGFWVTTIPNFGIDLNTANPDKTTPGQATTGDRFEGTTPSSTQIPPDEYQSGGSNRQATQRQQRLQNVIDDLGAKFSNKKILLIGDSHTVGVYGDTLERELTRLGGTVLRDGRSSWSVENWVEGIFNGRAQTERRNGPKLNELMSNFNPDIVIISLGANDWFRGRVQGFSTAVSQLWNIARTASKSLWVGPPQTVGRASNQTSGLQDVNNTISNIVGSANFVISTDITNITEERDNLGIHFRRSARAIDLIKPWIDRIINRL